jgi:hypothetical protein
MRRGEIPLSIVVEACYSPDIANKVEDDLIEGEDCHEGNPDVSQEVLNIDVPEVSGSGSSIMAMASSTSMASSSSAASSSSS